MKPHVVRPGDYLTALAAQRGVSPDEIWHDPAHDELRAQRDDMDCLHPGDVLQLPERQPRAMSLTTGGQNRFRAVVPKVAVHLTLRDARGNALENAAFRVPELDDEERQTDGRGVASIDVPTHLGSLRLEFDGGQSVTVTLGHMDPISEPSGVDKRLAHLGYFVGDGVGNDEEERLYQRRMALLDFQRDQGLSPTGELDDETRDAIRRAHGS